MLAACRELPLTYMGLEELARSRIHTSRGESRHTHSQTEVGVGTLTCTGVNSTLARKHIHTWDMSGPDRTRTCSLVHTLRLTRTHIHSHSHTDRRGRRHTHTLTQRCEEVLTHMLSHSPRHDQTQLCIRTQGQKRPMFTNVHTQGVSR